MQISTNTQTTEIKNSDVCVITKHHIDDKSIDFAMATISGRYPNANYAINRVCKEIVYVTEGKGKVVVEDKEHHIGKGDVILIDIGEKFYWEGQMKLLISCRPAWHPDQYEFVE